MSGATGKLLRLRGRRQAGYDRDKKFPNLAAPRRVAALAPDGMTLRRNPPVINVLRRPLRGFAFATVGFATFGFATFGLSSLLGCAPTRAHAEPARATERKTQGDAKKRAKAAPLAAPRKGAGDGQSIKGAPNPAEPRSAHLPEQRPTSLPVQRAVIPPPDLSQPPPTLPAASHEKMRACAEEWSKIKMERPPPLPPWRDFAGKCLTR